MAELQRNFLQGIMNKDLDPHFLPDGQYRDGLNIIVGDSDGQFISTEGSNNGSVQNYLGNRLMNSSLGLTNAKCIGALSYSESNLIYWLVAADNADAIFEYNETLDLTTTVLRAAKTTPTTPSLLNFNKSFYVTGINYINGLLFWTDNYNPPRKINIERCKNFAINNFATVTAADINVIVQPPLSSPTISFPSVVDPNPNNLENKFLYFSYRYKYIDDEYSSLSPFSPVAFLPKPFAYDYGVSENVSMVNSKNAVDIKYNTGGPNVKEVQLIFIDTLSTNAYIIDNINKRANGFGNNQDKTFRFQNNKVYTVLPSDQINRLFDNVPLKAKSQDLIGSRLVYGNYTQFFNLTDYSGLPINPKFSLTLIGNKITDNLPHATFKSNRDYEVGIVYLDDYGRSTTVIVPTVNTNTIFIPADRANYENNIQITIDKSFAPPAFATYYRFVLKQNKQDYYNVFPLTYFSDGQFKWFLINQSDVDKISVGSYLYLKNSTNANLNTQFKVLDIVSKSANFLNNNNQQPAGVYFKVKIGSNLLPDVYQYSFTNINTGDVEAIANYFPVAENPIFYGNGNDDLRTSNSNSIITSTLGGDVRFTIQIDSVSSSGDTYKVYAFYNNLNILISENNPITAGSDITLSVQYFNTAPTLYPICRIKFLAATGHNLGDYWAVTCRNGQRNIFGGPNWSIDAPYGYATGSKWNPTTSFLGDREIKAGALLTFKMKEPNNGNTQSVQSFVCTRNYRNIEEWFFEDSAYSKWIQYSGVSSIGPRNVCFRRLVDFVVTSGNWQGECGGSISSTTLNSCMFMYIYGVDLGTDPIMEVIFDFQQTLSPVLFETVPTDTNQDIYYELTNTYPIINNSHQTNGTNQILPNPGAVPPVAGQNGIAFLNKQDSVAYPNYDFNAFAWSNGVESFRIRDDFNSARMDFSPRANSTIEGYAEQTLVQALTYSGVYQQTTAINRLNEFNLSLGNFKYLDRFFGNIQKLYARDTDLVVFQENKVSKVLYGKNLLSDSAGGGTIASIPEVLGTQLAYVGEYGISDNPESFAIWGNNLYFADARRGAVLQLAENGLFEISSNGMKNWFKANLDPSTQKLGMFDPYFEHYVLVNNTNDVNYCLFEVSDDAVSFSSAAITNQFAFGIESNNEWYITMPTNNWLTLDTLYGNTSKLINFSATANTGATRSVVITVKGCSGNSHNVTFTQATSVPTTTIAPTTTIPPTTTTIGPTTTLQQVWYRTTACVDGSTVFTTQRNIGTFAVNDRLTFGGAFFVVQEELTTLPGGPLIAMTGTGLTGCPATTTTVAPTTTLAPVTFTYTTSCAGGAGTGVITITSITGGTGTGYQYSIQPTPGIWYDYPATNQLTGLANNTYNVAVRDSLGNGSSITGIVINCGAPTTTIAPTTTLQPVWYRTTSCLDGSTVFTTQRTIGSFAINDRLTFGGVFFVVQEELYTLPGGSLVAMVGTGFVGCPATTTLPTTPAPTTTLSPVSFTYATSCAGGEGTGVITITGISGGTGTGYQFSIQPTPGIWYDYPASNQLTGLGNGTYTVAVRDSLGNGTSTPGISISCITPTTTIAPTTTVAPTTTTIAPTTTVTPTTTVPPVTCSLYQFTDDVGNGGFAYYVPCGQSIETEVFINPFASQQFCVANGTFPFSPDGIVINGPLGACT
jgi:hypothetical protein